MSEENTNSEVKTEAPKAAAKPKAKPKAAGRPRSKPRKAKRHVRPRRSPPKVLKATRFWAVVNTRTGHPILYSLSLKSAKACLDRHRHMTRHQGGAIGGELVRQYRTTCEKQIKF